MNHFHLYPYEQQPQTPLCQRSSNRPPLNMNLKIYFFTVLSLYALITFGLFIVHTSLPLQHQQHLNDARLFIQGEPKPPWLLPSHSQKVQRPSEQPKPQSMQQQQKNSSTNSLSSSSSSSSSSRYKLAGLNCDLWGGPNAEFAQHEMVYWRDIPSDESFVFPLKKTEKKQQQQQQQQQQNQKQEEEYFLTFEPDGAGFNNVRMAFETTLSLAVSMGRTLVLPAADEMYRLNQGHHANNGHVQRSIFGFEHFFNLQAIQNEHKGVKIISMQEFLERHLMHTATQQDTNSTTTSSSSIFNHAPSFPPDNRTDWNGIDPEPLYDWLRNVAKTVVWLPDYCLAVMPSSNSSDDDDLAELDAFVTAVNKSIFSVRPKVHSKMFVGKPFPVNANAFDRLKENLAGRDRLCLYDAQLQNERVLHFPDGKLAGSTNDNDDEDPRFLVHFYAFVFFQNWQHDLWLKRFIRDHVRFVDEIQCAAARIVAALRTRVRQKQKQQQQHINNNTIEDEKKDKRFSFDTMHVRRGDFQFESTRVNASDLLESMRRTHFPVNGTVYIATDEREKSFFDPLRPHYDIVFLDDFYDAMGPQLNSNYFGLVDLLVATRGRYFIGCWYSTFTGYINRLRGYRATLDQYPGYEQGVIPSWYYAPAEKADHMQVFYPVKKGFFEREFPTAWRDIDFGLN